LKKLKEILYKVAIERVSGLTSGSVTDIAVDSRQVIKNCIFVAVNGGDMDGHDYINEAIASGASSIVCEQLPKVLNQEVVYIQVNDSRAALGYMAANFHNTPSSQLHLVGITGTNGKTTVATLLFDLFNNQKKKVGLISTVAIRYDDKYFESTHTTPNPIVINQHLRSMVDSGVTHCFIEVSSHGIDQKRITGLAFTGAIFTNLTHDHLDYHPSFKHYRDTKKLLFDGLDKNGFALTNVDDKNGRVMLQNCKAKKQTYSMHQYADFKVQVLEHQFNGMLLKINQNEIWTQLQGEFNAYNLLAVYATAQILGDESWSCLKSISQLKNVPGRFQTYQTSNGVMLVIDYAHTPDALKNVLNTINKIRTQNESLFTIIGCGGNRDQEKRPLMGKTAASLSSKVIFTSDNPRDEDPEQIIEQINAGVKPIDFKKTMSVTQRREAIKVACQMSKPGDIILIAGKGHENYQEIRGERKPFDDYKIAKEMLSKIL
tara:strand:- start:129 stop:1589 length:1461 start_codon:yes stop_codon:yes gene_type:complete